MNVFDGSTSSEPPQGGLAYDAPVYDPPATPASPEFDAFEALRESMEDRDEETSVAVEVPGIDWRLVCRTGFEYREYRDWQKAALPRSQRNGRKVNPLDMDQALLAHLTLLNTCSTIEYRRGDGGWVPLTGPNGDTIALRDPAFLERMGAVDPRVMVRRLFGGDGHLIAAGQKVIVAAGYGGDDDAEDPTD